MPVDVTTEVVIARPRDEVAAFAEDPSNAPAWYARIDRVEPRTPPPPAVGGRYAFSARFVGRRLDYVYEVVEHEPGRRLVMRTADGPFAMETTYRWDDAVGGGTRMTLRNRGGPTGPARLLSPLMARAVRSANRKDLAALRRLLEAPA